MTPLTKEQKKAIFDKLPTEIKQPMVSEETAKTVAEIAKKNGIVGKTVTELAAVLGDIYLGLLTLEELPVALVQTLKIEPSRAEAIKKDASPLFSNIVIPLLKLREQAKVKSGEPVAPQKSDHPAETHPDHLLERGHVLAMIENPHLHENTRPINAINALAPKPKPQTIPQTGQIPRVQQVQTLRGDIEAGKSSGTFSSVVAQKMAAPTSIPKSEKVLQQNPSQDPYREPIN